eukprot:TRINITY_DN5646_c0_g1_i1.p1 TRINITY_DN5646_c0_g1~~TRINITY_DN5646_c0_g1_i1.p1  ORF type:complete len:1692 (+),score=507.63 TRINITY_DN5646_c0_g1_i1:100-5175(+)
MDFSLVQMSASQTLYDEKALALRHDEIYEEFETQIHQLASDLKLKNIEDLKLGDPAAFGPDKLLGFLKILKSTAESLASRRFKKETTEDDTSLFRLICHMQFFAGMVLISNRDVGSDYLATQSNGTMKQIMDLLKQKWTLHDIAGLRGYLVLAFALCLHDNEREGQGPVLVGSKPLKQNIATPEIISSLIQNEAMGSGVMQFLKKIMTLPLFLADHMYYNIVSQSISPILGHYIEFCAQIPKRIDSIPCNAEKTANKTNTTSTVSKFLGSNLNKDSNEEDPADTMDDVFLAITAMCEIVPDCATIFFTTNSNKPKRMRPFIDAVAPRLDRFPTFLMVYLEMMAAMAQCSDVSGILEIHLSHSATLPCSNINNYFNILKTYADNFTRSMNERSINLDSEDWNQEFEGIEYILRLTNGLMMGLPALTGPFVRRNGLLQSCSALLRCGLPLRTKAELLNTIAVITRHSSEAGLTSGDLWQEIEFTSLLPLSSGPKAKTMGLPQEVEQESALHDYPLTLSFCRLLTELFRVSPVPNELGTDRRVGGVWPYLRFGLVELMMKFRSREFKHDWQKWEIAANSFCTLRLAIEGSSDDELERDFSDRANLTYRSAAFETFCHLLRGGEVTRFLLRLFYWKTDCFGTLETERAHHKFSTSFDACHKVKHGRGHWKQEALLQLLTLFQSTLNNEKKFLDMARSRGGMKCTVEPLSVLMSRDNLFVVSLAKLVAYRYCPKISVLAADIFQSIGDSMPDSLLLASLMCTGETKDICDRFALALSEDMQPAVCAELQPAVGCVVPTKNDRHLVPSDLQEYVGSKALQRLRLLLVQFMTTVLKPNSWKTVAHLLLGLWDPESKELASSPITEPTGCLKVLLDALNNPEIFVGDNILLGLEIVRLLYGLVSSKDASATVLPLLTTTHQSCFFGLMYQVPSIEELVDSAERFGAETKIETLIAELSTLKAELLKGTALELLCMIEASPPAHSAVSQLVDLFFESDKRHLVSAFDETGPLLGELLESINLEVEEPLSPPEVLVPLLDRCQIQQKIRGETCVVYSMNALNTMLTNSDELEKKSLLEWAESWNQYMYHLTAQSLFVKSWEYLLEIALMGARQVSQDIQVEVVQIMEIVIRRLLTSGSMMHPLFVEILSKAAQSLSVYLFSWASNSGLAPAQDAKIIEGLCGAIVQTASSSIICRGHLYTAALLVLRRAEAASLEHKHAAQSILSEIDGTLLDRICGDCFYGQAAWRSTALYFLTYIITSSPNDQSIQFLRQQGHIQSFIALIPSPESDDQTSLPTVFEALTGLFSALASKRLGCSLLVQGGVVTALSKSCAIPKSGSDIDMIARGPLHCPLLLPALRLICTLLAASVTLDQTCATQACAFIANHQGTIVKVLTADYNSLANLELLCCVCRILSFAAQHDNLFESSLGVRADRLTDLVVALLPKFLDVVKPGPVDSSSWLAKILPENQTELEQDSDDVPAPSIISKPSWTIFESKKYVACLNVLHASLRVVLHRSLPVRRNIPTQMSPADSAPKVRLVFAVGQEVGLCHLNVLAEVVNFAATSLESTEHDKSSDDFRLVRLTSDLQSIFRFALECSTTLTYRLCVHLDRASQESHLDANDAAAAKSLKDELLTLATDVTNSSRPIEKNDDLRFVQVNVRKLRDWVSRSRDYSSISTVFGTKSDTLQIPDININSSRTFRGF